MGKLLPIFQLQAWNIFEALLTFPNSNIKSEVVEVEMQLRFMQNQSIVLCTGPSLVISQRMQLFCMRAKRQFEM